jgi:glycolate oxidase
VANVVVAIEPSISGRLVFEQVSGQGMNILHRLRGRRSDFPSSQPSSADDALVAELQRALSNDRVHTDGAHRSLASRDASVFGGGVAGPLCDVLTTEEVAAVTRVAIAHGRAIVPRGAGTGLAGGAIPLGRPIVVSTARMNRILDVDLENRVVWVEPGVVNLDLTQYLKRMGFHFAPDPSSQQVCTIGGNVANNSGGPHCLAYGVTNAHILAIEVVLPNGEIVMLGGLDSEPAGLDLRGAFIGSEGTLGIATKIAAVITPNAPAVSTLLLSFDTVAAAANTVSAVIASGIVPAAMEVMDQRITIAVENYVHAGYPTDAAAVLLAEVDGMPDGVATDAESIERIGRSHGATSVRRAATEDERKLRKLRPITTSTTRLYHDPNWRRY